MLTSAGNGVGGSSRLRIAAGRRPETGRYSIGKITVLSLTGNNRLWYNIDNKRGRKLYNVTESQETGKNGPGKRFRAYPYKIPWSRQKRRTDDLHKIWEYKNGLNCTPYKDSGKRHTYI